MNFYENDFREFFNKHDVDTEAFVAKIEELFPLFKSIAEQMGFDISINDDLEEVLCHLRDVYSYGMSGGFSGFIYYYETSEFFDRHCDEIIKHYENMIQDLGHKNFDEMLSSFTNGGNYIYDELINGTGLERLKNDLVWGYVESYTFYLFDTELDFFEDCFDEKISKEELKVAIENRDNEFVIDFLEFNKHIGWNKSDFIELKECAENCNNKEIIEAINNSGLIE